MITVPVNGALCGFTTAAGAVGMSANLGRHVGDDPDAVTARRRALADALGTPVVWMDQTHSADVATLDSECGMNGGPALANPGEYGPLHVDGIVVAATPELPAPPAPAVMTADCIPLLLVSSDGLVVAAVHVGRAGLDKGIHANAVRAMAAEGAAAEGITALIGPAVCGRCYEVPQDLQDAVVADHPAARSTTRWGTPGLDLPGALAAELHDLGLRDVRDSATCTLESPDFYSYRRTGAEAGRQAAVVAATGHWRLAGPESAGPGLPWHTV